MFLLWLAGLLVIMVTEKLGGFRNIFHMLLKAAVESIHKSRRNWLEFWDTLLAFVSRI